MLMHIIGKVISKTVKVYLICNKMAKILREDCKREITKYHAWIWYNRFCWCKESHQSSEDQTVYDPWRELYFTEKAVCLRTYYSTCVLAADKRMQIYAINAKSAVYFGSWVWIWREKDNCRSRDSGGASLRCAYEMNCGRERDFPNKDMPKVYVNAYGKSNSFRYLRMYWSKLIMKCVAHIEPQR